MLSKRKIISIDVSKGKYSEFVEAILQLSLKRTSSYVCVANVHMLIEAQQSEPFQKIVNNANIVTPDGMPLAKCFSLLYNEKQERVDGMSLLPALLDKCELLGQAIYFYGGSASMLNETQKFININYPAINIAGMYSPPFRELSDEEMNEVAAQIEASGASLIFVVLGCPKQEKWMAAMKGKISGVMIGIGGALPVLIGMQKRAPGWMQKNSLEWLFRLIQEPNRLFNRYWVTNHAFLFLLIKEKLKMR